MTSEEEEKLYMATVRVFTKGHSIEKAKENLMDNIIVVDDIYENPEITTLEHLEKYPDTRKRIREKILRELKE